MELINYTRYKRLYGVDKAQYKWTEYIFFYTHANFFDTHTLNTSHYLFGVLMSQNQLGTTARLVLGPDYYNYTSLSETFDNHAMHITEHSSASRF